MPITLNVEGPYQRQAQFYMQLLNMPGLTNEQRQALVGKLQGVFSNPSILNPYRGLQWPTTTVMGPGNPNAPTGGLGADVSGLTIQAPASGGAFGSTAGAPAPAPSQPLPTTPQPGQAAAQPVTSTVPAPSAQQALGTTMPGATFQGQPQPTTQYVLPAQDPMQQPVSSQSPQVQQIIRNAMGQAGMDPSMYPLIQGMTLGDVIQRFPILGMALQYGGFGGGAPQGGTAAPVAPTRPSSGMSIFGGAQPSGATPSAQATQPTASSFVIARPGMTWAQVFPFLAQQFPQASSYLNTQIPLNYFMGKGGFDYTTAQRAIEGELDRTYGSPHQQSVEAATTLNREITGLNQQIGDIITSARQAAQSGGVSQQDLHGQLQAARAALQTFLDNHKDPKDPNYQQAQQAAAVLKARLDASTSQVLYQEGAYRRQQMDLAQKNYQLNLARLGISQQQAGLAAARLGVTQQEFAFRMQTTLNSTLFKQYDAAQARGDQRTMKALQPQVDAAFQGIGGQGPYRGAGRPTRPQDVTPGERAVLTQANQIRNSPQYLADPTNKGKWMTSTQQAILKRADEIDQRLAGGGSAPTSSKWTPPAGAIGGTKTVNGKKTHVWKVGNTYYTDDGRAVP